MITEPGWSEGTGYQLIDLRPGAADGYIKVEAQSPTQDRRGERVTGCENRQVDIRRDVSVELNCQSRRPSKKRQRVCRCLVVAPHQRRMKIGRRERPPSLARNHVKIGKRTRVPKASTTSLG